MSYITDEINADNSLDLWMSCPDSFDVTLCHRTDEVIDEWGNVLGMFTVSRERRGWELSVYSITGCMYNAVMKDRWDSSAHVKISRCSTIIAEQARAAMSSKKSSKTLASPKDFT